MAAWEGGFFYVMLAEVSIFPQLSIYGFLFLPLHPQNGFERYYVFFILIISELGRFRVGFQENLSQFFEKYEEQIR
jgi:hypothetical protein